MRKSGLTAIILGLALASAIAWQSKEKISRHLGSFTKATRMFVSNSTPKEDYAKLKRNPIYLSLFYKEKDGIFSAELSDITTGKKRDITSYLKNAEPLNGPEYLAHWSYDELEDPNKDHKYEVTIKDETGRIIKSSAH